MRTTETTKIKPALRDEEWKPIAHSLWVEGQGLDDGKLSIERRVPNGDLILWNRQRPEAEPICIQMTMQQLAALALHNQSFGFSHEELESLEVVVLHSHWPDSSDHDVAGRVIAKLRALLPPTSPPA